MTPWFGLDLRDGLSIFANRPPAREQNFNDFLPFTFSKLEKIQRGLGEEAYLAIETMDPISRPSSRGR